MKVLIRLTAFALLLALPTASTWAGPGDLDLTFGVNGEVPRAYGATTAVARMPDGRILMYDANALSGGEVRLRAKMLTAGGQPVASWGAGGESVVKPNFHSFPLVTWIHSDLSLAGAADGSAIGILQVYDNNYLVQARAIRLRPDGSFDTAYDAATANLRPSWNSDWVNLRAPHIQSDGSALVSVGCNNCDIYPLTTELKELRVGGRVDRTFHLPPSTLDFGTAYIYDARTMVDGRVVIAGDFGVLRFNASGTVDATYNTSGTTIPRSDAFRQTVSNALGVQLTSDGTWVTGAVAQADGRVVLGIGAFVTTGPGRSERVNFLVRVDTDGNLDAGFGNTGKGIARIEWSTSPWASSIESESFIEFGVAPNGSIVGIVFFTAGGQKQSTFWRLDAAGRPLANAVLPVFQPLARTLIDTPDTPLRSILAAGDDGSNFLLNSRSLVRFSATSGNSAGLLTISDDIYVVEDVVGTTNTIKMAVTRIAGSNGRISIDYTTAISSTLPLGTAAATADSDYVPTSGRLQWEDGESDAKFIQLTINNDAAAEPEEHFLIRFSNAIGGPLLTTDNSRVRIGASDRYVESPPSALPQPLTVPTPTTALQGGSVQGGGGAIDAWSLLALSALVLMQLSRRYYWFRNRRQCESPTASPCNSSDRRATCCGGTVA